MYARTPDSGNHLRYQVVLSYSVIFRTVVQFAVSRASLSPSDRGRRILTNDSRSLLVKWDICWLDCQTMKSRQIWKQYYNLWHVINIPKHFVEDGEGLKFDNEHKVPSCKLSLTVGGNNMITTHLQCASLAETCLTPTAQRLRVSLLIYWCRRLYVQQFVWIDPQ